MHGLRAMDASDPFLESARGEAPLRVAFDVSVVGRGHFHPRSRTGLFRVALELAHALEQAGIDVRGYATVCRGEAEAELELRGSRLRVRRSALERSLFPLARRLLGTDPPRDQPLPVQTRRPFRTLVQMMEGWPGGSPRNMEKEVDIFHSPYDPITRAGMRPDRGQPKVITVHDVLPLTHPRYFGRRDVLTLRRVLEDIRFGAWAHCVSSYTQACLLRLVPEASKRSFVAHLGANPNVFFEPGPDEVQTVRKALGLQDEPYVLCLGTRDARKNHDLVLRVYRKLKDVFPRLKLVLAGATTEDVDSEIRGPSCQSSPSDGVRFAGFMADEQLSGLYGGASAFLFPSFVEGFGLPVLEAMQCGVPVIASDTSSLPEVASGAAILARPDDIDAWVRATRSLLSSPTRAADYRARGLERARQLSWSRTTEALVEGYREALSSV